ncbi:unnamed protein product [Linum tenue]|uniref:Uncharacterized protein n=1 Tax=Linum tenue TaxID=586396 RepID=A0AAV0GQ27_9ROSI|nr:unnamed protein product [Linum tenue]
MELAAVGLIRFWWT